jgi:hypothetical protein
MRTQARCITAQQAITHYLLNEGKKLRTAVILYVILWTVRYKGIYAEFSGNKKCSDIIWKIYSTAPTP